MLKGIKFLMRYTWRFNKMYIVYILFLQIINSIMPLVTIIMPKYIIDELIGEKDIKKIILYVVILVGINLVGGILSSFLSEKVFTSKNIIFNKFQSFITNKLAMCDYEQIENAEFLDIKEKAHKFLYANGQGFGVVLDSFMNILGKIFIFAGIITIISTLNIGIVIIFIILVLLNTYVESKAKAKYVALDMKKAPIERKTSYLINLVEDFTFAKEIRLYNLKDYLMNKLSHHLNESANFYNTQVKIANRTQYFSKITTGIREIVAYGYLIGQTISLQISIGDFSMYIAAIAQFSGAMNDVMQSIINIKQFSMYYEALDKFINVPEKMRMNSDLNLMEGPYDIEFKDVSFKYPGQEKFTLEHINLCIRSGEKLSIVGENGAGKTTFIKLLIRLYDPTEGVILLNGVDIRKIQYDQYQSVLSAVFQDFKLFSFSLKENITFNDVENVKDEVVEKYLEQSGVMSKVTTLDKGIHTSIHKNFDMEGFEPSGGEAQKIALGRALYKNTPIVILDEPTAALDPRAEYEIYQHFNEMIEGKTAIYISHRLSSTRFCDKIVTLKQGCIYEYGTHEELVEKDGLYAELFHMQAQFYT
ncbi:MAG: ABC transporter ATP-binding protein [Cellulosilyticaceae bacterium]